LDLQYPTDPASRTEWILAQRPQRTKIDPNKPYAFFVEEECSATGEVIPIATIFLTNRECPWRCVMCDLWKNTLTRPVEPGAIPRQIAYALERLPPARQVKLYNSGSFFDVQAIPREDYSGIVALVRHFDRTIVECHPSLVGTRCFEFSDLLSHRLEVAMGLETVDPEVLSLLNKGMTLDLFAKAAASLRSKNIDLRAFILVQPPFMKPTESLHWAQRSIEFAFDCGATAASLIPTRGGNGAMESLAQAGDFIPPKLRMLEAAMEYGIRLQRGRVFSDLWDLRRTGPSCVGCYLARIERLAAMNLRQQVLGAIECARCEGQS
jgi:radical SAM enzyme (TIGR01210 family)